MAKRVKCIVLSGNGTNCEMEMAYACKLGGADEVDIVHISELIYGLRRLDSYHFLNLPGGFLDGDDLGAAKAGANRIKYARVKDTSERLYDQLLKFIKQGKLILGICNGFQLMVKAGLLPGFNRDFETQTVTLTYNDSGRFEDRWVCLKINPNSPCIFTKGMERVYLPVRHGEGKFIPRDEKILKRLHEDGLVVVQYSDEHFQQPTMTYPLNPNGSVDAIAGICDESGRLFGMMPHPEAYLYYTNHPRWTRERLPEEGEGILFFRNAITYIRETLL
ncbi:MAG TPA: phosphoribosylformylglycinamidine synthase subunit PurQ [Syntrophaceae bacterium]|nr:phosphoribosylformylglycinamidine synthase subunit PurQ [Syntrophaceae bacterium]